MRILIVEDEKKVAGFIKKGLEEETYAIDVAYDGEEGLHLGKEGQYDLIVLDTGITDLYIVHQKVLKVNFLRAFNN